MPIEPPTIAIFPGTDAATRAIATLGLRLLGFAAPGVALLEAAPGTTSLLHAAGARIVIAS